MNKMLIISSVLIANFSINNAVAMPDNGSSEFSLSGAGSSDKDFDNNIFAMDATYGRYMSKASEWGVRQLVSAFDAEGEESNWNGATRLFYDYHFQMEKTRPFIGINLGYIYGDTIDESFIAGPELGIKYYALENTFVFGQIEYQFLFDDADEADDRFDDGAYAYSLGVGFNF